MSIRMIGTTAVLLALLASPALPAETRIGRGEMKTFELGGRPAGAKVYLTVTGRYEARGEGEWLQRHIALRLNGTMLDGRRIVGSKRIVYPRYGVLTERGPMERYDRETRTFAFKFDSDFSVNNPPYMWDNPVSATTEGYSPTLVLDVTDLAGPGANRLVLYNSNAMQLPEHEITGVFVLRETALTAAVPSEPEQPFPSYPPVWVYFRKYPAALARYRAALERDIPAELKAEIAASIGIYHSHMGNAALCRRYLERSLAIDPAAPSADEVRYRLLTIASAAGDRNRARALADELRPRSADSPWAGLGVSYYGARFEGKRAGLPRPVALAPLRTDRVVIDGILDDALWKDLPRYGMDAKVPKAEGTVSDSRFMVCATPEGLLWGFEGALPPADQAPAPRQPKLNSPVWETNCFELFLDPDSSAKVYYELNMDDNGGVYNGKNTFQANISSDWNPTWKAAAFRTGDRFSVEYFVPWRDIGRKSAPARGSVWGVNVVRVIVRFDKGKIEKDFSWSPLQARNFHRVMDQGLLVFE